MNEFNQKHAYDNFDKEFSRSGKGKLSAIGKFPRWGWGLIAGVVLAGIGLIRMAKPQTQTVPTSAPFENRAEVVIPTSADTVSAQAAVHSVSTGDEMADSNEFAAVMASKSEKSIILPEETIYNLQETYYSVSIEELPVSENGDAVIAEPEENPDVTANTNDSVIVWIEQTPFQVHFEKMTETPAGSTQSAETLPVIQIEGHPYAIHMENNQGEESESSDNATFTLDEQPVSISVEDLESKSISGGNWFVEVFHSLFGENEPTPMPTGIPVTVIVEASPTLTEIPTTAPTSTPEVQPTKQPTEAGPVRLDSKSVESDLLDAPLYDDSTDEDTSTSSDAAPALISGTEVPVQIIGSDSGSTNMQITAVVHTIAPEAPLYDNSDELPETGMAEDWNIPMMIGAAAGLLLIIIVTRRLRKKG